MPEAQLPDFGSKAQTAIKRDYIAVAVLSAVIAAAALIFFYLSHALLLYGDAVAHINIARRVFDSRTPGLVQLGTVWLPLPHLLNIPFVMNDWLWRTGLGASVPSMIAFVAGTLGVFRLVCGLAPRGLASRSAAWLAALVYVMNPNLIYMQATAMTEALYLALFIWAAVFFSEFARQAPADAPMARRSLERCAIALCAAMMVRYDGWFLAAIIGGGVCMVLWRQPGNRGMLGGAVLRSFLLVVLTATLWLAYNHAAYGNALEFANGPYSARAIAQQSRTPTMMSHPGENDPRTAALFFLKVSRLNLG
ncbi:MAG TPA: phospholipid carrier-dependent glycosyltransferase, partial [Alphaproteobacteria bacterium]|nr:phospholipid carrier-dependent glycosyltransferase [Alphaproteobacteria bacterium]